MKTQDLGPEWIRHVATFLWRREKKQSQLLPPTAGKEACSWKALPGGAVPQFWTAAPLGVTQEGNDSTQGAGSSGSLVLTGVQCDGPLIRRGIRDG